MKQAINLYSEEDLIKQVKELGRKRDRSISWLINRWIEIKLNKIKEAKK